MKNSLLFLVVIFMLFSNISNVAFADEAYTYQGDLTEDGVYEGNGKLYYQDILLYEGGFHNHIFDGEGTLYHVKEGNPSDVTKTVGADGTVTNKIKYKGTFENGLYQGEGTVYYAFAIPNKENQNFDGTQYKGKFLYGKYNGYGVEYSMTGEIKQQGYFINGTLYKYKGPTDENGKMHGEGKLHDEEGNLIFEGTFAHGEIHGNGTLYDETQKWKYIGPFVHDLMEGKGKIYINDELYYDGEFKNSLKEGKGTIYFAEGEIAYQGQFEKDRTVSQPFQTKSELKLEKDMSGTYSVYVVLLNEFLTESTNNHFNKLKGEAEKRFDSVKVDKSNEDYISFKATSDFDDLTQGFTDKFSGFNIVSIKTKLMIYNQFEVYGYLASPMDLNLMNVNYEVILPDGSKNVNTDQQVTELEKASHFAWVDIKDTDYKFVQFQAINIVNIVISAAFFIIFIAGMVYFRTKKRNKKMVNKTKEEKM